MARIRTIKPEFFKNEDLAAVSAHARLAAVGLLTLADRAGRMDYRPKRMKAELFPYEDVSMEALVADLEAVGFVRRYDVQGRACLQIANFLKHQYPHMKEPPSTIPAPDEHGASTVQARVEPGGKGREGNVQRGYPQMGNSPQASQSRPLPPTIVTSRRAHLDHVWCGERFCIPAFVADDCWQAGADLLSRDAVIGELQRLAPAWEAAINGKPLDDPKRYVKQQWRTALASMRDRKTHAHEERLYDCATCGGFHRGQPSEGCKAGSHGAKR